MLHECFFPLKPAPESTWLIAASGPSAKTFPFHKFSRVPVLAVNNAWTLCKAAAVYACDPEWWEHYGEDVVAKGPALRYSQFPMHDKQQAGLQWKIANRFKVFLIAGAFEPGISRRPDLIHYNGNGGAQAINLAVGWGAKVLLLAGFDMKGTHFHEDHPPAVARPIDFNKCVDNFRRMASDLAMMGVKVFNLNPDSAIDAFRKVSPEDYLANYAA